ncbi:MAG: hypothetical protein AAGA56_12110, partial [Myxococcota bacterium]
GGAGGGGRGGPGATPISDADRTATEVVLLRCPPAPPDGGGGGGGGGPVTAYTIVEGTDAADGPDVFPPGIANLPVAYVLRGGNDDVVISGYASGEPTSDEEQTVNCVVGGPTDDTLQFTGTASGETAVEYSGSSATNLHFYGGDGADTVDYQVSSGGLSNFAFPVVFTSFESGVDKVRIDKRVASIGGPSVMMADYQVINNFNPATPVRGDSCADFALVLDPMGGSLWLSTTCEGFTEAHPIVRFEGDAPVQADIEIYESPAPD